MSTEPVDHATSQNLAMEYARTARRPFSHQNGKAVESESPATAPVPGQVRPDAVEGPGGDKVPGVIRLLEDGHFKGVADVRLRINFFDELSARAAAVAQQTLEEKSGELVEVVRGGLDDLLGTLEADEGTQQAVVGLRQEFEDATGAAVEGFSPTAGQDADTLAQAVSALFDALTGQLTELFTVPPADAPTPPEAEVAPAPSDGTVDATDADAPIDDPADPPLEEPATPLDNALQILADAFHAALQDLVDSITSAVQLPDPSPQMGNGSAYDKFMAIYDNLRGLPANIDEQA